MPATRDERLHTLRSTFTSEFGEEPAGFAQAPGRVNLIGEHVDYNDGLVLPVAIERNVLAAWRRRDGDAIRVLALDASETDEFDARDPRSERRGWAAYVRGVVCALRDAGHVIGGSDLAFTGDVPQGAGLSSSAALEVAVAGALRDASSLAVPDVELALICQRAENECVGVRCGIMDQFASALSREGHALLIDCRSLEYRHLPLRLANAGLAIVIVDSGVRRELASSAYNERRRECERALETLRERPGRAELASLRDITADELERALSAAPDVALRRARHVVTEIARVERAVAALERDDFAALGELMRASHASLRDDYEVSIGELDLLVDLANGQGYVAGARMTGAGFGGCTMNLVESAAVAEFERDVVQAYRERTGLAAQAYVTSAAAGLRTWRAGET